MFSNGQNIDINLADNSTSVRMVLMDYASSKPLSDSENAMDDPECW